jgi:ATP-dependent exoDNAse (exonuclease V) beta subunit
VNVPGKFSEPADHAVREQALDPTRSFIVEAPAGSGKTELLTRRYLRLLACVRAPEEILAITFTRKAAAEMRSRVLRALSRASDPEPENLIERALWQLARSVSEVDERLGWHLLAHPARLRIMTIDALNSSLAQQLPILSGAGAALAIARDSRALYAEVVLRLIERLSGRDPAADAIARLMRHLDNRYDVLEGLLSQELARREHWLDLGLLRFDVAALRGPLESALSEVIAAELKATRALVPIDSHQELVALATHGAAVLNSVGADSPITACDSLTNLPACESSVVNQWSGLATLLLTKDGEWRARIDKNIGFPPEDKPNKQRLTALIQRLEHVPELAESLHRTRQLPCNRYTESQWQVLTDLLAVLKLAITELEVVMRERGEADYVANAIAARRALGSTTEPTDLAMRLDYRLQHLRVDEFQDTSRGQVELLALLTAGWSDGDGRTLFCVGDPMQSIYRFRNADVGLFLNLKRHGLNQLRLTPLRLTVNFRATKPVLEWVNRTFVQTLPRTDDPDRGAVAFTASDPHANASSEGGVFVHPVVFDKTNSDRDAGRSIEAAQIAALIQRVRTEQSEARIAVLVSNRSHLRWIIGELRSRGVAFQAVEIDPLARRPAIQDLVALTRAIVHLADRIAWLAVLRAPWCGLSLADLHSLCGNSSAATETVWQLIQSPQRAVLTEDGQQRIARIESIMCHAVSQRGRKSLRDCIERTWHALGGPASLVNETALQDCGAYFDRLEEIERNGDIEDIAMLEESLRDLYATANSDAGGAKVELMTIHRAKGLEFDVVILPALDSGARPDDPPLLRAQELPEVDGENALLLAPIAARGEEKDSIYTWLEQLEKERAHLEKGRLLYVAATRAERELHLFAAVEDSGGKITKPRAHTFLHLLWSAVESAFVTQTPTMLPNRERAARLSADAIQTLRLPLDWQVPKPQPKFSETSLQDVVDNEPLHPEFEWVSETGRHVGTLVHREIERLARIGSNAIKATTLVENKNRYSTELAELGVPPHLRDAAIARVIDALTKMVADKRGRWLLAGEDTHREAASELALSGIVGSAIVNGVIDRTFVADDGTRWIVDFKTSTHEGGGLNEFLQSEVERYRQQLQRYAQLMRGFRPKEPIKAALYFPLLQAWCEVPV